MSEKQNNSRLILDISVAIIAFFALGISIWQIRETRKHNLISTKPILCFRVITNPYEKNNGIFLVNRGLGPALIKSMKINGKEVNASNHMDHALGIADQAKRYNISFKEKSGLKYVGLECNEIVSKGESVGLVEIPVEILEEHKPDVMMEFLNNVKIIVKYADLYNSSTITVKNPE